MGVNVSGGFSPVELFEFRCQLHLALYSLIQPNFSTQRLNGVKAVLLTVVADSGYSFGEMTAMTRDEAVHQLNLENFKAVLASSRDALKSAILINGGAGVALLAFMGQMQKGGVSTAMATWLPWSLACFVLGVLVAAIATGASYLAQDKYYFEGDEEKTRKRT
jgi:hypothetical protein